MTPLESIPLKLGVSETWQFAGGVHWLNLGSVGVRALAAAMNEVRARLITITAYELPKDEGFRLEYHWDLNGNLLGFPFTITQKSIDSIFDICPAVDWIEREIHEEYSIDFAGRAYEPLLLKPGATLGVNLRELPTEVAK